MANAPALSAAAPWWQGALVSFMRDAMRWLRARFPGLQSQHEDLVAECAAQLTQQLMTHPDDAPASWFMPDVPPSDDIRRFHGLAFTVLSRRITDAFRRDTTSWLQSLDDMPDWQLPADSRPDAITRLDQARAARALIEAMQALSLRDRLLLEQVALGDAPMPMPGADRERLRGLRSRLRAQLAPLLDGMFAAPTLTRRPTGDGSGDA